MTRAAMPGVQERIPCAHPGCTRVVVRPRGASSICGGGHPIPATPADIEISLTCSAAGAQQALRASLGALEAFR